MIILISGGTSNGKGHEAIKITKYLADKKNLPLNYICTLTATNTKDNTEIENTVNDYKEMGYNVIEQKIDIAALCDTYDLDSVFLLDSLTALLANEMFTGEQVFKHAENRVIEDLKTFIDSGVSDLVMISDYIYSNSITFDDSTDNFCRALGKIDFEIAKIADVVIEICFGAIVIHKGKELLTEYQSV